MRQTRATWFIINSLLGILFIIWGAIANSHPLIPGDRWLVLPGLILFATGLFGIFEDFLADRRIIKFLSSQEADGKTLIEIAGIINCDEKQLRELVMSLRAQGKITKYYDPTNGFLVSHKMDDKKYCPNCGHPNLTNNFCIVCGKQSSLLNEKKE